MLQGIRFFEPRFYTALYKRRKRGFRVGPLLWVNCLERSVQESGGLAINMGKGFTSYAETGGSQRME